MYPHHQVQEVFLQWIPWLLRMSRPGEKITRKTIMMAQKMKDLDMKEMTSQSLLTNVLDIDDDFRATTLPHNIPLHHPSHVTSHQNPGFVRYNKYLLYYRPNLRHIPGLLEKPMVMGQLKVQNLNSQASTESLVLFSRR